MTHIMTLTFSLSHTHTLSLSLALTRRYVLYDGSYQWGEEGAGSRCRFFELFNNY